MKLLETTRLGSKLKRRYVKPQSPLERLLNYPQADHAKIQQLKNLRQRTDPFALAKCLDQKLQRIYQLANYRVCPNLKSLQPSPQPLSRAERQALQESLNSWASMPTQKPTQLAIAELNLK
jgi:hypothetical protein